MPNHHTSKTVRANARQLRRDQTLAEVNLWLALRSHQFEGIHFRRQHPIGNFIVDFSAPSVKLIIEVDGAQHLDQQEYDAERTAFLESKGYRVLRFWNDDLMGDLDGVLLRILEEVNEKP